MAFKLELKQHGATYGGREYCEYEWDYKVHKDY